MTLSKFQFVSAAILLSASSPAYAQPLPPSTNITPVNDQCPAGFSLKIVGQQIALQGFSGARVCVPNGTPYTPARLPSGAESVVKIWVTCAGKTWTGAGVLVSRKGHILTAGHVGSLCIGNNDVRIDVGPVVDAYKEPSVRWSAKLIGRVADGNTNPSIDDLNGASFQDAALYKIENFEGKNPVAALAGTLPVAGDPVSIFGFSNMPFEYENTENAIAGISVVKGSLLSVAARRGIPFRLHTTIMTLPGLSGGPLIDASGSVIGIHSSLRIATPNYFTWATSVAALPVEWISIIQEGNR